MHYPTLHRQAAILFYLLNKNHPFVNGNKRMALICLMTFLFVNGEWLEVQNDLEAMYHFAVFVAASPARDKDIFLEGIHTFIENRSKPINVPELLTNRVRELARLYLGLPADDPKREEYFQETLRLLEADGDAPAGVNFVFVV